MNFENINDLHKDVLREIGNIGAGNAATSLSAILNKKVNMDVPEISVLPFNKVVDIMGGADNYVAGCFLEISGEAPMSLLFVIPKESINLFITVLLGLPPMEDNQELDEMSISALKEITNILAGSYLTALNGFTQIVFDTSVPAFAYDMAGAILGNALYLLGNVSDSALVIKSLFKEEDKEVDSHLFLLPEPGTLEAIFEKLGVSV